MAYVLRACASIQKGLLCDNFTNLGRSLTCITDNGYSLERFSTACNVRRFSTRDQPEIPEGRTEIYSGNLTRQIRNIKVFTLMTSTAGLTAQPFFYLKAVENDNIAIFGMIALVGFLSVVTPLVIHVVTKKYVTCLYYNAKEDKYIANTYSLFLRTKEHTFTPDDVVVPDVTGPFTSCIIKGTPLYLEQQLFRESSHYSRIMGYDKPIDFKLSNNNRDETIAANAECKGSIDKK